MIAIFSENSYASHSDADVGQSVIDRYSKIIKDFVDDAVSFHHAGLEEGFKLTGQADVVLANIISDVLCIYADNLIASVSPGGVLALSGILAKEQAAVRAHFEAKGREAWGEGVKSDGRIMGEWSDVALFRPL